MLEYVVNLYDVRVLIILAAIYLLYKFGKGQHNLHLKLGHEGPPALPFLGNLVDIFRHGFHELDKTSLRKYGRIYPFYFGNIKLCMVADEELLRQILIKEAKCFADRLNVGFNGKFTEKMLNLLNGKEWERVRNLVSPTFTSGKLRKMVPLISEGVDLLEERISNHPAGTAIDFKEFFGAFSMDVIARTMFGMEIDIQTNPKNLFVVNATKIFNSAFNPLVALCLLCPKLALIIHKIFPNMEPFEKEAIDFFSGILKRAIDERQKSLEKYNDFLALMLQAHKEIDENDPEQYKNLDSKSLSHQEVMAQAFIFLLGGYETTASTLTCVSYFLAKNSSAQQEVFDEIMDKFGTEGEITYESLMNIPVLDAAISETLRLCPPLVRFDRKCTQDTVLIASDKSRIIARKGDIFTVPVYAIHTDPSIWPDPDKFDLHRFDPENKRSHSPYSLMPFGMGPRTCIGMRFALLEAKLALVRILRKFEIVPCAETLKEIQFKTTGVSILIQPTFLKIAKRK